MRRAAAALAAAAATVAAAAPPPLRESLTVDVLVYAANPAGIGAAIAAANGTSSQQHSVLLLEPLTALGGMGAAGGVGLMN